MKQTFLAFGDSNTHGTPPMHNHDHHPRIARRWPVVMAEQIDCTLIEDGLPGRTACQLIATSADIHLDGHLGLRMALLTHGPIDHLLIMLGTNDLQWRYGKTPSQIIAGLAGLVVMAQSLDVQAMHGGFKTTLICPPPIAEVGSFVPELYQGADKSRALLPLMQDLAQQWGLGFFDAGAHITVDPTDGTHFSQSSHDILGKAIARSLA